MLLPHVFHAALAGVSIEMEPCVNIAEVPVTIHDINSDSEMKMFIILPLYECTVLTVIYSLW